ncbi:MAG TPA: DUF4168 domain-containing protein [Burkholderiaceae bacterium]|nr:DUF4168 domain-containing protein [Burkholderiaceae bacterium]
MKPWITTACLTALLALAGAAAPAMAQQTQAPAAQPPSPAAQKGPAVNYSDAQLRKFVGASKKVAVVVQEYNPKLQSSPDEASREKIAQEANKKMVDAVQKEGMSVNEFNSMSRAIQQDPTLMKRAQDIAK